MPGWMSDYLDAWNSHNGEKVAAFMAEAAGLPATNKAFRIRGVSVGRLDPDGKIKHNRDYWNMADYLIQVGMLSPPQ